MSNENVMNTPWVWNGQSLRGQEYGETVEILVAEFPDENEFLEDHKKFIALACNSHYELLEALKKLSTFEAMTTEGWGFEHPEITARVEFARAVIAKFEDQS